MDAFFEARAVAKFGAVPVETLNFSKEINVLKQRGKDGNNLRGWLNSRTVLALWGSKS